MARSTERTDLLAALHPITRALRRIEEEAAGQEGLTMWRYAILSVVADRPGASQREIAAHLQYSPNRLVVDLRDLERRGWVTRRPGADRRANVLDLTESGEGVRRRIQAEVHRREDALLEGLPADRRDCFDRAARELADLVRRSTTPSAPPRPPSPA
jgi:DNA-binding MarR family transcriptional regulator